MRGKKPGWWFWTLVSTSPQLSKTEGGDSQHEKQLELKRKKMGKIRQKLGGMRHLGWIIEQEGFVRISGFRWFLLLYNIKDPKPHWPFRGSHCVVSLCNGHTSSGHLHQCSKASEPRPGLPPLLWGPQTHSIVLCELSEKVGPLTARSAFKAHGVIWLQRRKDRVGILSPTVSSHVSLYIFTFLKTLSSSVNRD